MLSGRNFPNTLGLKGVGRKFSSTGVKPLYIYARVRMRHACAMEKFSMAKLTRKQYTRKAVFAGVAIFVSAVLIVTGVAIWLLFSTLSTATDGGITVTEVAKSPLSFSSLQIDGQNIGDGETLYGGFVFDSLQGDEDGRVSWNGKDSEKMSITVSGVIMNAQHLSKFSYSLSLPHGVIAAAEKGYLDISEFYDAETGEVKVINLSLSENGSMASDGALSVWRFSFTISIKWGAFFHYLNPSIYYDTEGLDVPLEDVIEILEDMRSLVNGNQGQSKYTLTLTASPNN